MAFFFVYDIVHSIKDGVLSHLILILYPNFYNLQIFTGGKLIRFQNAKLSPNCLSYDELVWEDTKYLPEAYLETAPELVLRSGDIVMALDRPITNSKLKVSIVDDREHYILYQRVGCLRKRNPANSTQYLRYALLSQSFLHQVESHLQGSDQPYINLPPLKSLNITMCSECEQIEIVRILDILFVKEQQAEETAEAVLEKIDLLKKSILARAFRGEVGTNDPAEESAVELPKRTICIGNANATWLREIRIKLAKTNLPWIRAKRTVFCRTCPRKKKHIIVYNPAFAWYNKGGGIGGNSASITQALRGPASAPRTLSTQ